METKINPLEIYQDFTQVERDEFDRELYRTNLKELCNQIFSMYSVLEEGHDKLFKFLYTSKKNKKLIMTPRETFKTTLITAGLSIQEIIKNPNITILLSSYVESNAISFLRLIKNVFENNRTLKSLFGNFVSDKWNESEIIIKQRKSIDKTPTISVSGADKSTTSQHYDLIFADDLVNRQTISTLEQMEKTERHFSDIFDLLKKPDGKLFIIGTRWDGNDLYGKIIKDHAGSFDILNLMATDDGTITGRQLYPKKYNENTMKELLGLKGSYDFYLQIMNTVTSSDTMIFNPPVRYWSEVPSEAQHCVTVDPAISKKKDSCDAVVVDTAITKSGQMYVVEYTLFKEIEKHPSNILEKVFQYVQRYGCRQVGIEANGYQEVLCFLLEDEMKKRKMNFEVVPIRQSEDKARRITCLQPYWQRGDLLLKNGMQEAVDQFNMFRRPITSKVDLIDAIAMRIQLLDAKSKKVEDRDPDKYYSDFSKQESGWTSTGEYIPLNPVFA